MRKVCKCCGQVLPSKFKHLRLAPGPLLLLEAVAEAGQEGINIDRLYQKLYGDRRDGGPDPNTVRVRVCQLNKRHLWKHGLKIVGKNNGRSHLLGSYVLTEDKKISAANSQDVVARNF